ncbi:MAG: glycosyltransferase [Pseudomonadota bacterium]
MVAARSTEGLQVALAHDWLTGMRGGEAVLERLCLRYPHAPLYTLFHIPGSVSSAIEDRRIVTSILDRLPGAHRRYRQLLPLYPAAVEALDVTAFDLVVSTSHCAIKALRLGSGARHLCYVHTPMRYVYEQFDDYFGPGRASPAARLAMTALRPVLQAWDRRTAHRPTELVANSQHVAARIRRHWGREASVVHPPVAMERFAVPEPGVSRDHYLVLGALAPYKRVDLAVRAFAQLGLPLIVAGDGPEAARLQHLASPNVRFVGRVDDDEARRLYQGARALIFPGEEDFGITPLEAQACGTPVIAFGRGGALETVRGDGDGATGVFFGESTESALIEAVRRFERVREGFDPSRLREHARRFEHTRFDAEMSALLEPVEELVRQSRGVR